MHFIHTWYKSGRRKEIHPGRVSEGELPPPHIGHIETFIRGGWGISHISLRLTLGLTFFFI